MDTGHNVNTLPIENDRGSPSPTDGHTRAASAGVGRGTDGDTGRRNTSDEAEQRIQLSSSEFYWALLDLASLGLSDAQARDLVAARSPLLDAQLAPHLPVPIGSVHAAYTLQGPQRVLACALERERLTELTGDDTLSLTPSSLPESFNASTAPIDLSSLNLLVGEFTPRPLVPARRKLAWSYVVGLVCATVALATGLHVQTLRERRVHAAQTQAIDAITSKALSTNLTGHEAIDRLDAELTRARRARQGGDATLSRGPVDQALANLLSAWPRGESAPNVRTESISIAPEAIALSIIADTRTAAIALNERLQSVAGWTLAQPQVSAASSATQPEAVRVNLRLTPSPAADRTSGSTNP
jgi:Tfp pilus assembly protein PilN